MAKDPAVLLYTSDFLSGTYTMTDEQVGKYIKLLCYQHQKGKLTEKDMISICKGHDEDVYAKFDIVDGFYINKRMYEEAEKRTKFTESRRKNASAKHMLNHMPNHMEDENENENKDDNRIEYISEDFKNLWQEWKEYKLVEHKDKYKSIKTEQKAIAHLENISNKDIDKAKRIVNLSIANKWKGIFEEKVTYQAAKPQENKLSQYTNWLDELNNKHEDSAGETNSQVKRLSL